MLLMLIFFRRYYAARRLLLLMPPHYYAIMPAVIYAFISLLFAIDTPLLHYFRLRHFAAIAVDDGVYAS